MADLSRDRDSSAVERNDLRKLFSSDAEHREDAQQPPTIAPCALRQREGKRFAGPPLLLPLPTHPLPMIHGRLWLTFQHLLHLQAPCLIFQVPSPPSDCSEVEASWLCLSAAVLYPYPFCSESSCMTSQALCAENDGGQDLGSQNKDVIGLICVVEELLQ